MTANEVRAIAEGGESAQVEFKKTTGQRQRAAETVCAMLNGAGGVVLFGVKNDGTVTGQEVTEETQRDVVRELRKIEPRVAVQPEVVDIEDGRSVIALRVPGDADDVHTYDGRPYLRQGPTTARMPQAQYRQHLIHSASHAERWEAQPATGFGLGDLDHGEITRTVDEAIRRGRLDEPGTREPEALLRGLGLMRDGTLLNAAVVLFGQPEEKLLPYYPQCFLRMARFDGTTKSAFLDNRQEHGHAFDLFQRAQRFLRDHLPIAGRVLPDVPERKDEPLYPTEALREALANALCHRDYRTGGSVGVAIYDDRLEITSTGTLPGGLTPEDLTRPHDSKLRNELIADTFYRRGLIEEWGRGTLKMAELNEAAGLVPPEFEERSGTVLVRFRPTRYMAPSKRVHDLSPLQQELLTVLGNRGALALSSIMDAVDTHVTERTMQRNLKTLRELSMVRLEGHGRGARWMLDPES